ncbi:hypothetical protein BKA70DRAFT_1226893 [Coprinopsis sp. MPI-PUGE-AT-0042]|nr:hypothetical protein BKA70DRAFT_1226893 [Coprinopsis sp. MPI-PUGE-AT-0042]
MSTAQIDIPRPEGWDDASYEQLVQLITFARDLKAVGGSEGILSLITQPTLAHIDSLSGPTAADVDLNWANGTGFSGKVWSEGGWGPLKTTIKVELTTDDGHHAQISFGSGYGWMIVGTRDIRGNLGFSDWSSLKAGANQITVNMGTGKGPILVNGTPQGEFAIEIPRSVPSVSVSFSFNWDCSCHFLDLLSYMFPVNPPINLP